LRTLEGLPDITRRGVSKGVIARPGVFTARGLVGRSKG